MKLFGFKKIFFLCVAIACSLTSTQQAEASRDLLQSIKKIDNAKTQYVSSGLLRIDGWVNPSIYFVLDDKSSPEERVLRLRMKTNNALTVIKLWWNDGKNSLEYPNQFIPIDPSPGTHAYDIDLDVGKGTQGGIKSILISFLGVNDEIEIEEMLLIAPEGVGEKARLAASNFMLPIPITPPSINLVYSPFAFGIRLSVIFSIIFIALAVFFTALYLLRRKTAPYAVAITLLALWMCYDLRNMYNQYFTYSAVNNAKEASGQTNEAYNMDGFYGFAAFLKKKMPPQADGYSLIPGLAYSQPTAMKYLLYPLKPYPNNNAPMTYNIVHESKELAFSGNTLYFNGQPAAKGEVFAEYNKNSFIFKEWTGR